MYCVLNTKKANIHPYSEFNSNRDPNFWDAQIFASDGMYPLILVFPPVKHYNFLFSANACFLHCNVGRKERLTVHIICNTHLQTDLLSSTPVQTRPLITVCSVIFVYEDHLAFTSIRETKHLTVFKDWTNSVRFPSTLALGSSQPLFNGYRGLFPV